MNSHLDEPIRKRQPLREKTKTETLEMKMPQDLRARRPAATLGAAAASISARHVDVEAATEQNGTNSSLSCPITKNLELQVLKIDTPQKQASGADQVNQEDHTDCRRALKLGDIPISPK